MPSTPIEALLDVNVIIASVFAAYAITLQEMDELLDDSLKQTALLLADRDLSPAAAEPSPVAAGDTESELVAMGL